MDLNNKIINMDDFTVRIYAISFNMNLSPTATGHYKPNPHFHR